MKRRYALYEHRSLGSYFGWKRISKYAYPKEDAVRLFYNLLKEPGYRLIETDLVNDKEID